MTIAVNSLQSKDDQKGEHAVKQEDWVCYEKSLVLHVEAVFKKACCSHCRPCNDSQTESDTHYVVQVQEYGAYSEQAEWQQGVAQDANR